MKLGIITIHNSSNYGACLQSFALYEYLNKCGYDVEIIDLHRPCHPDYIFSKRFKAYAHRNESIRQFIIRCIRICITTVCNKKGEKTEHTEYNQTTPASYKFDVFNSRIRLSRPFISIDELYKHPPIYDVYITGSDQVWNPTQPFCIEPYFLTFAKHGYCISFASSIGIEHLTHREERDFRRWLAHYEAISVREYQAKLQLQKITEQNIQQVADPTFLLDLEYWKKLMVIPAEKEYILVFTLSFEKKIVDYGKKLAIESNKKLVVLNPVQPIPENDSYIAITDAGPEEFIGYIANADMVITDSFHCTLFSIICGAENFFSYIGRYNERGSRILDLLHIFNLDDHLLNESLNQTEKELKSHHIDRDSINKIYYSEQAKARKFLLDSLSAYNGGK